HLLRPAAVGGNRRGSVLLPARRGTRGGHGRAAPAHLVVEVDHAGRQRPGRVHRPVRDLAHRARRPRPRPGRHPRRRTLRRDLTMIALGYTLLLLVLILLRVPVSFAVLGVGIAGLLTLGSIQETIGVLATAVPTSVMSYTLSAAPLFIF